MEELFTGNGRSNIATPPDQKGRTNSFSKRAKLGKIAVIDRVCPFCSHHKAIRNEISGRIKCSRCKL